MEVGPERLEPFHETYLAGILSVDGDAFVMNVSPVAKSTVGVGPGGVGREPELAELLLAHREMERELVVDVPLDGAFSERESEQPPPAGRGTHTVSSEVRRSATAIASACRCQRGAWARNRARPAVVSR